MELDLLFSIFWLILSLIGIIKSADIFTDASERIGLYFGLSSFIVGATIVSIGSSLPELATSLVSVISHDPEQLKFPIDNIIGSNIANTLLVGGLAAMAVGTLKVKEELIDVDLPFFFISSALFLLFIIDGDFTWKEGIISLFLLVIFIAYTINDEPVEKSVVDDKKVTKIGIKEFGLAALGAFGVYLSAKYTVSNVLAISAKIPGIDTTLITMLVVAIGTSLPEIIVSVRSAIKGKHSIALGNIFGSNTFNALAVAGIPSFFGTLTVSEGAMRIGIPFFIASGLAFIFTTTDNKIPKWEGYALIVIYIAFVGKLLGII